MSEEDIVYMKKLLQLKFKSIRISDPFKEKVRTVVEANEHIDIQDILWFPIAYCSKKDGQLIKNLKNRKNQIP